MGYWKRHVLWPNLTGPPSRWSRGQPQIQAVSKKNARRQSRRRAASKTVASTRLSVRHKPVKKHSPARKGKSRAAKTRGEKSRKVYERLLEEFIDGEAEEVEVGDESPSGSEQWEDHWGEDLMREHWSRETQQREDRLREIFPPLRRDNFQEAQLREDDTPTGEILRPDWSIEDEPSDDGPCHNRSSEDEAPGSRGCARGRVRGRGREWQESDGGLEDSSQPLLLGEGEPFEAQSPVKALIPGLPDDLALQCLARLPYKQRMAAKAVSRRWSAVLGSMLLYRLAGTSGLLQDHLCICQLARPVTANLLSLVVRLYNPSSRRWLTLPPRELWNGSGVLSDFESVAVGPRLFVIGGAAHMADWDEEADDGQELATVSRFNALSGRWDLGPSLNAPRSQFVAGAVDGRLYVMDGLDGKPPEVLDLGVRPLRWRVLRAYDAHAHLDVQGSFVRDGALHILRCPREEDDAAVLADIHDAARDSWRTQRGFCGPGDRVAQSCGRSFAVVDGAVYGLFVGDRLALDHDWFVRRQGAGGAAAWRTVAVLPAKHYARLECLTAVQLVAVGRRLFVIASGQRSERGSVSLMSVLDLGNPQEQPQWEVESVPIKTAIGEPCQVYGATSIAI